MAAPLSSIPLNVAARTLTGSNPSHSLKAAESVARCAHTCQGVKPATEASGGVWRVICGAYGLGKNRSRPNGRHHLARNGLHHLARASEHHKLAHTLSIIQGGTSEHHLARESEHHLARESEHHLAREGRHHKLSGTSKHHKLEGVSLHHLAAARISITYNGAQVSITNPGAQFFILKAATSRLYLAGQIRPPDYLARDARNRALGAI